MTTTIERLCKIISEFKGEMPANILETLKPETHFNDDLGFDDLDMVELSMTVEDLFHVHLSDEDHPPATIGDFVKLIERKPRLGPSEI